VEDPTAGEPAAAGSDLTQEFERIDVEKERLRRLAAHLGFDESESAPAPASEPAAPVRPIPAAAPPPSHHPRPSLPLGAASELSPRRPQAGPGAARASHSAARGAAPILEALNGFVPAALYGEMKQERDELFFRLARLESERSQVQQVRRALDIMEAEIRRLEAEIRRRRAASAPSAGMEELRRAYRRWLDLRRRRSLRFSDFLAVRRTDG
jgi:hypothetical protein